MKRCLLTCKKLVEKELEQFDKIRTDGTGSGDREAANVGQFAQDKTGADHQHIL
jgi:hypothetical protein